MAAPDPVAEKGLALFRLMPRETPSLFDRERWTGQAMAAVMDDPDLKVRLFRFVDVLPALSSSDAAVRHLKEYFLEKEKPVPGFLGLALGGALAGPAAAAAASILRKNVAALARTFIAGSDLADALPALRRIRDEGRAATVDLLGEAAVSEPEADDYRDGYLELIAGLAREMGAWPPPDPARERRFPRLSVSVKPSSLYSRIGPVNHDDSVERVKERLRPLFRAARNAGGTICLDMEHRALKEVTLDIFTSLFGEAEFDGWEGAGIALQAYLRETRRDVDRLARWARERGRRVTVRLVKGAYWETEIVTARLKRWPVPVFPAKGQTDWHFERCVEAVLGAGDALLLAAGTHNVRSIAKVLAEAEARGLPPGGYEFQMLYGMAGPVKEALRGMGHPVRDYVPVGELLPGMAYLVRRLLENSSNEGFLRRRFAGGAAPETLLSAPPAPTGADPAPRDIGAGSAGGADPPPFANEPPLDFSIAANRDAFRAALREVRSRFGRSYAAVVAGRERRGGKEIISVNPASPAEVVGAVAGIDGTVAEEAVSAAVGAQRDWGRKEPGERAAILFRAARIARARRLALAAWQVFEVGKSWAEADADVIEAIDYLEYYGREMIRLGKPVPLGDQPGEENRYFYGPRGVGLVVAPWNFPLAISMGMVSAALVAGNAVLYKPSSLSPVNGWLAFEILREAGVPEGLLHFIPGRGGDVAARLVEHPDVAFVLFTGSREVGLGIVEKAGRTRPGQRGVKKVVAEMGGKNAIIVDDDADLDQAIPAVVRSAFGYQGQKCSACSRAIVVEECHDRFVERLAAAVRGMSVGPPEAPGNALGPVIDGAASDRIRAYVDLGKEEGGEEVVGEIALPGAGYYVPPAVFTRLPRGSRLLREEIFGPVLSVVRARDLDEALAAANDSEYALTGGLFSRSPSHIARAAERFEVGNLYVNREITGAIVGRQPFGGFRMSGVGSKAGGFDYLLQFLEPRTVTESTLRRGFAPGAIS